MVRGCEDWSDVCNVRQEAWQNLLEGPVSNFDQEITKELGLAKWQMPAVRRLVPAFGGKDVFTRLYEPPKAEEKKVRKSGRRG